MEERCRKEHVKKDKIKEAMNQCAQLTRLLVMTEAAKSMVSIRDNEPTVNTHRLPHPMWNPVRLIIH